MIKLRTIAALVVSGVVGSLSLALGKLSVAEEAGKWTPWMLPAASSQDGSMRLMPGYAADWSDVLAINYSPDGKQIVTGGSTGNIRVWDAAGLTLVAETHYPVQMIRHAVFEDSDTLPAVACQRISGLDFPESRSRITRQAMKMLSPLGVLAEMKDANLRTHGDHRLTSSCVATETAA